MAYTTKALMTGMVHCLAIDGKRTKCQIGLKVAGVETEATLRAKLIALAAAIQGISNAMVTHTTLTMSADDGLITIDDPTGQPYLTIEDRATIQMVGNQLDKPIPVSIPGPVQAIVDTVTKETIDFANVALGEFLSWAADYAVDYAKRAIIEAIEGKRERAPTRTEKAGVVPLLPP